MNIAAIVEAAGSRGLTLTKSVTSPGQWCCTIYAPNGKNFHTLAPTPEGALAAMGAKLVSDRLPVVELPRLPPLVTR